MFASASTILLSFGFLLHFLTDIYNSCIRFFNSEGLVHSTIDLCCATMYNQTVVSQWAAVRILRLVWYFYPIEPQWICVHLGAGQTCTARIIESTTWVNMFFICFVIICAANWMTLASICVAWRRLSAAHEQSLLRWHLIASHLFAALIALTLHNYITRSLSLECKVNHHHCHDNLHVFHWNIDDVNTSLYIKLLFKLMQIAPLFYCHPVSVKAVSVSYQGKDNCDT